MTFPATLRDSESRFSVTQEVKLVPRWSIVLAAFACVYMQYLFWMVLPAHRHHPSSLNLGVRIYIAFSWSAMAALYFLMAGYVSRDAPRRGMKTGFWTIICLMPGGLGAVLYFLLREPVLYFCPSCNAQIYSEFHFCPQCAFQVAAACGTCFRGVRITDLYCTHCGHDLALDNTPARLREFQF